MLSYNNTIQEDIKNIYQQNYDFPLNEYWLFYDEDSNGNGIFNKVLVTYKQDNIDGFLLDTYIVYQLSSNGNVSSYSGDKESAINQVLNNIELHFSENDFINSLEVLI